MPYGITEQVNIGSVNGISPAIILTHNELLFIEPSGRNFIQNTNIFIQENSFNKLSVRRWSCLSV